MTIKRASTLTKDQVDGLRQYIENKSRQPERDDLILCLSHYAGLRVSEIAKLSIDTAFLNAEGQLPPVKMAIIHIYHNVGKKQRERDIPMHPEIHKAIKRFMVAHPFLNHVAFSPYNPRVRMKVNALTVWFYRLYENAGYQKCSSHSGRRTFATTAARRLADHHTSLRDLQILMGHSRLETTEGYIEPSGETRSLVSSL